MALGFSHGRFPKDAQLGLRDFGFLRLFLLDELWLGSTVEITWEIGSSRVTLTITSSSKTGVGFLTHYIARVAGESGRGYLLL